MAPSSPVMEPRPRLAVEGGDLAAVTARVLLSVVIMSRTWSMATTTLSGVLPA